MRTGHIGQDQLVQVAELVTALGVAKYRDAKKKLGFDPMGPVQHYSRMDAALLIAVLLSESPANSNRGDAIEPDGIAVKTEKKLPPRAESMIELGQTDVGMTIRFLGRRTHYDVIMKNSEAIRLEAVNGDDEIKAVASQNYWLAQVEVIKTSV